jgi:hypothetical protein
MSPRPLLAAAALLTATVAYGAPSDAARPARLHIRAVGATLEFRTLGLPDPAFTLNAGQTKTWRGLAPGRYVVVQAPPRPGGLQITCTDGHSAMQYDLAVGDNLTCTFTAT